MTDKRCGTCRYFRGGRHNDPVPEMSEPPKGWLKRLFWRQPKDEVWAMEVWQGRQYLSTFNDCTRFPQAVEKTRYDSCGEYEARDD